ncbi:MAG: tyrosine-type recombinase/integrase [Promethearchaeota archaeon]
MKYIESFLNHLKLNHYAKRTINSYFYNLKKLDTYFNEIGIEDEKLITEKYIIDYLGQLKNKGATQGVYYRTTYEIKKYFKYLEIENIIFISPTANIELPKDVRVPTKVLSKKEITTLLDNIKTDNPQGVRVKTILELLYSSALRPGEVTNIKIADIDFNKKILFIRLSKNKKDRVVPVTEKAIYWIEKYIKEVRPKFLKNFNNNYLFIPHYKPCNKEKLNYRDIFFIIRRYFIKNNLKRFKLYSLRSSSSTHLLLNGMSILHIQKLLGHNKVTTTKTYLQLKTRELKSILNTNHPRNKY